MISDELLNIIACPETKQGLILAGPETVEKVNSLIEKGGIKNRLGEAVGDRIDGGLVREDGKYLYPIRGGIPVLLIEEAISLDQIS